ncbi:MAG TPA: hypothetical protein VHN98_01880, partial [Acidimicrobiales bacterium]|nr:hypothetical protein [Acidimicrobiales bacterium]
MRVRPGAGVAAAVAFAALVIAGGGGARLDPAGAQQSHRAAVVVDLGDGSTPRAACVSFDADSISGIDALRTANMSPEVYGYSQGAAVCALCGKGCPADSSCLTCHQPWYWAYSRAPAGSTSFTYWGSGAGRSTVHDGDVEGWRWSDGSAGTTTPAYQSADQVCAVGPWYRYTAASTGSAGTGSGSGGGSTTSTTAGPSDAGSTGGSAGGSAPGAASGSGSPTTAAPVAPPAVPGMRA